MSVWVSVCQYGCYMSVWVLVRHRSGNYIMKFVVEVCSETVKILAITVYVLCSSSSEKIHQ